MFPDFYIIQILLYDDQYQQPFVYDFIFVSGLSDFKSVLLSKTHDIQ